jgi:fatty acid desaturase
MRKRHNPLKHAEGEREMAILRDNWIVIAIAVAAVIVALALLWGIWWLWWRLPQRQVARLAL